MAGTYNITVEEGATWSEVWSFTDQNNTPINLTGCTAKMDWRVPPSPGNPLGDLLQGFNSGPPYNNIAINGPAGTLTPSATSAQTAALAGLVPLGGTLVYDLFVTFPGGQSLRYLAGSVVVVPRITQQ